MRISGALTGALKEEPAAESVFWRYGIAAATVVRETLPGERTPEQLTIIGNLASRATRKCFESFSEETISQLFQKFEYKRARAKTYVFREREVATQIYLLASGKAKLVHSQSRKSNQSVRNTLGLDISNTPSSSDEEAHAHIEVEDSPPPRRSGRKSFYSKHCVHPTHSNASGVSSNIAAGCDTNGADEDASLRRQGQRPIKESGANRVIMNAALVSKSISKFTSAAAPPQLETPTNDRGDGDEPPCEPEETGDGTSVPSTPGSGGCQTAPRRAAAMLIASLKRKSSKTPSKIDKVDSGNFRTRSVSKKSTAEADVLSSTAARLDLPVKSLMAALAVKRDTESPDEPKMKKHMFAKDGDTQAKKVSALPYATTLQKYADKIQKQVDTAIESQGSAESPPPLPKRSPTRFAPGDHGSATMPICSDLPEPVVQRTKRHTLAAGMFKSNDSVSSAEQVTHHEHVHGPGSVLGVRACLAESAHESSALAIENCELLCLSMESLQECVEFERSLRRQQREAAVTKVFAAGDKSLERDKLRKLTECFRVSRHRRGTVLCWEGERRETHASDDRLQVIVTGRARMVKTYQEPRGVAAAPPPPPGMVAKANASEVSRDVGVLLDRHLINGTSQLLGFAEPFTVIVESAELTMLSVAHSDFPRFAHCGVLDSLRAAAEEFNNYHTQRIEELNLNFYHQKAILNASRDEVLLSKNNSEDELLTLRACGWDPLDETYCGTCAIEAEDLQKSVVPASTSSMAATPLPLLALPAPEAITHDELAMRKADGARRVSIDESIDASSPQPKRPQPAPSTLIVNSLTAARHVPLRSNNAHPHSRSLQGGFGPSRPPPGALPDEEESAIAKLLKYHRRARHDKTAIGAFHTQAAAETIHIDESRRQNRSLKGKQVDEQPPQTPSTADSTWLAALEKTLVPPAFTSNMDLTTLDGIDIHDNGQLNTPRQWFSDRLTHLKQREEIELAASPWHLSRLEMRGENALIIPMRCTEPLTISASMPCPEQSVTLPSRILRPPTSYSQSSSPSLSDTASSQECGHARRIARDSKSRVEISPRGEERQSAERQTSETRNSEAGKGYPRRGSFLDSSREASNEKSLARRMSYSDEAMSQAMQRRRNSCAMSQLDPIDINLPLAVGTSLTPSAHSQEEPSSVRSSEPCWPPFVPCKSQLDELSEAFDALELFGTVLEQGNVTSESIGDVSTMADDCSLWEQLCSVMTLEQSETDSPDSSKTLKNFADATASQEESSTLERGFSRFSQQSDLLEMSCLQGSSHEETLGMNTANKKRPKPKKPLKPLKAKEGVDVRAGRSWHGKKAQSPRPAHFLKPDTSPAPDKLLHVRSIHQKLAPVCARQLLQQQGAVEVKRAKDGHNIDNTTNSNPLVSETPRGMVPPETSLEEETTLGLVPRIVIARLATSPVEDDDLMRKGNMINT